MTYKGSTQYNQIDLEEGEFDVCAQLGNCTWAFCMGVFGATWMGGEMIFFEFIRLMQGQGNRYPPNHTRSHTQHTHTHTHVHGTESIQVVLRYLYGTRHVGSTNHITRPLG